MSIEKILTMDIERREFIKRAGITGLALLTGCANSGTEIKEPEANIKESGEFDSEKFLRWYKRNKLYNGPNPNLKRPHHNFQTSKESMNKSVTPGTSYSVPSGEVMVAVAPGVVVEIGDITGTGRPGGMFIKVEHPTAGSLVSQRPAPYASF
jgi:hypothetical protein